LLKIFFKISINYIICYRLATKINYVYIINDNILIVTIITTAKKNKITVAIKNNNNIYIFFKLTIN